MRKRLSITIELSVLCIFAVVLVVWAQAHRLRYQGQNLQTWALQLNSPQPGAPAAANAAFKAMGPKAVPGLVDLLEAKDPGVRRRVWALATHLPRKLRTAFFRDIKWPDSTE